MHPTLRTALGGLMLVMTASHLVAAEFFVSPTGHDDANGSMEKPFATVQRAQKVVAPGDTVFIRGGKYLMSDDQITLRKGIYASVTVLDKSGSAGKPITYCAYQSEKPVFDFSGVKAEGMRINAFLVTGSWLHLKGLEVIGVRVSIKGHTQSECFENQGSHNIYEMLSMHDGQAIGFYLVAGSDNLVLNCDAYRNHDFTSEDGRGGNTDGFGCHPRKGGTGNVFRGCRAWLNSDDGYDCISAHEAVTFDHCWAFYNGFSDSFKSLGDGNGFKAGGWASTAINRLPEPMPRHTVRFCLAVKNKASGFYANHHLDGGDWFNNSAYRNGNNYNMLERVNNPDGVHFDMQVPGTRHNMKNNLAYKGGKEITNLDVAHSNVTNNTFDPDIRLSDHDFMGLDESELIKPRQKDGALPVTSFMHPESGSVIIDRGVDVGFAYHGKAPDLGAFEY